MGWQVSSGDGWRSWLHNTVNVWNVWNVLNLYRWLKWQILSLFHHDENTKKKITGLKKQEVCPSQKRFYPWLVYPALDLLLKAWEVCQFKASDVGENRMDILDSVEEAMKRNEVELRSPGCPPLHLGHNSDSKWFRDQSS